MATLKDGSSVKGTITVSDSYRYWFQGPSKTTKQFYTSAVDTNELFEFSGGAGSFYSFYNEEMFTATSTDRYNVNMNMLLFTDNVGIASVQYALTEDIEEDISAGEQCLSIKYLFPQFVDFITLGQEPGIAPIVGFADGYIEFLVIKGGAIGNNNTPFISIKPLFSYIKIDHKNYNSNYMVTLMINGNDYTYRCVYHDLNITSDYVMIPVLEGVTYKIEVNAAESKYEGVEYKLTINGEENNTFTVPSDRHMVYDIALSAWLTYDVVITQPAEGGRIEVVYNDNTYTEDFNTEAGASMTINFIVDDGYRVESITINGTTYDSIDEVPDNITINQDTDITMSCVPDTATLTATFSNASIKIDNTAITSGKEVSLTRGQHSISITSNTGYVLRSLSGILSQSWTTASMTQTYSGTFNLSANSTLTLTTEQLNVTLTITQATGGTISVNGSTSNTTIPAGTDFTVKITPNSGYNFSYVDIDGTKYYEGDTIPSSVLTTTYQNKTITAGFQAVRTVTLDQTKHATLSIQGYTPEADGTYKIPDGATVTVTATPDTGYEVIGINKIPN